MKQKKHIWVRYFFIKDNIENGALLLKYYPTGEMYAYFFIKPLQGAWDMIQGITERTPDVEMSCPRAVDKVTSHACVV